MSDPILCVMSEWSSSTRCPCGGLYDRHDNASFDSWALTHKPHSDGTIKTVYDGSWSKVYSSEPPSTVEEIK